MLIELRVKNLAIVEALSLTLKPGFNVLSGETGAGKSIIVGALGFLLGERASGDLIRSGADRASVEGCFDLRDAPAATSAAESRGIDVENGMLVLKRELSNTGRGRAWVNGTSVTAGVLGDIGRTLVNLHGQHEAQALLDTESQREILDRFAAADAEAAEVASLHAGLRGIRSSIESLIARRDDARRRADYLRHVVREIGSAKLQPGEDARLEQEARVLENADELRTQAEIIRESLNGEDDAVMERLRGTSRALAQMQRHDPSAERLQELFDTGYYALEELVRAVDEYSENVELDPQRLADVRKRREVIYSLTSKYGPAVEDVLETGERAQRELDLVESAELDLTDLRTREAGTNERLAEAAMRLTQLRRSAAASLERRVDEILPHLGMPDGRFSAVLTGKNAIDAHGAEDTEFRIALNVGHAARPLARVASGGELSRLMLALKLILAGADAVPTLVFDEVDAGIGGRVGLQVGETLRRVAEHHQVFAISHLPQIAARAHNHIVVAKATRSGITTADVTVLDGKARVEEIARMLGGDPESRVSRAHARELLQSA